MCRLLLSSPCVLSCHFLFFPSALSLYHSSVTWPVLCLVLFVIPTGDYYGNRACSPVGSQLQYLNIRCHICLKLHRIQLILNVIFLGRVSSMASAPTSNYNSHSLENESFKKVSWVFRFILSLSLHFFFFVFTIRWSFWVYWILNFIIHSYNINTLIHVVLFIIPSCSRKDRLPYMCYMSFVCKSFHITSFLRTSILGILYSRY